MLDVQRKLIDAAERIAAEQGLDATTINAVQKAAGQRNKSAVHYHFGDRQGLLRAVIETRMAPTSARRTAMLLDLGPSATLRDLVEALLVPFVDAVVSRSPSYWARYLLQAMNDPKTGPVVLDAANDHALRVSRERIADRLDHLPVPLRSMRVAGCLAYAITALAALETNAWTHVSRDFIVAEIVDTACSILTGPSTAPPLDVVAMSADRTT